MAKIRNVVFDMGGVLMKYDPVGFARPFVQNEDDARLVATAVFDGREWPLLDAGVVDAQTVGWTAARFRPSSRAYRRRASSRPAGTISF